MAKGTKKSGQKLARRLNRFSRRVSKASDSGVEHIQENLVERIDHVRNVRLLILEWALLILAIIFLAITQMFWYRESYAVETYTSGGTYTEATLGKVNSLNPLFATTSSEKVLAKLMFGTLTSVDYSGHTGLGLVASVTADETGRNWSVKLREGLKWSDGEPITNADVLYTVRMIQSPEVNTAYSSALSGVRVAEAEGELLFSLPAAYANFSSTLNFPILPEHVLWDVPAERLLENSFSTSPVTSGAFNYNASQTIGTEGEKLVYLSANPAYYEGEPLLASMAVHAFVDTGAIRAALANGSVTATAELDSTTMVASEVTSTTIYEKQAALSSGVFAFLNMRSPILGNQALRKAIQEGLDMNSLRAPLDDELPLDYPILASQIEIADWPALPEYNPDEARQIIQEMSGEGELTLNLVTVNTGYLPTLADNLEYQLSQLGFKVEKRVAEPGQDFLISTIRPRSYDILLYEVDLGADPDLFPYYHSSQATPAGLNLSNYSNALSDALILGGRSSMNEKIRATRYETFLKYWIEDVPAIGVYQTNLSYYYNKNVRTFSDDDRLVTAVDRFSNVQYWAAERATKNRTP